MAQIVYLDHHFQQILENSVYKEFRIILNYSSVHPEYWLPTLPNNCDLIGISFYDSQYLRHKDIIDATLAKTKQLFVNISEPTDPSIIQYLESIKNPRLKIFTDIVSDNNNSYQTAISWFITPRNYYVSDYWAKELMSAINPVCKDKNPRKYMFDCLLGKERSSRNYVHALYLNKDFDAFQDKVFFRYFKDNPVLGQWNSLYTVSTNQMFGEQEVSIYAMLPIHIYNDSYYSIVSETTWFNHYSQFTEKVAKPIIAKRPFVVFCGQHYLKRLRSLGFKTFSDIIDESYDNESNDYLRWQLAWKQVENLCKLDPYYVYRALESILDHNQKHFLETNWHNAVCQVAPKF
jgi:hypothetical protein